MDTVGEFVRAVEDVENRLPHSPSQPDLHPFDDQRKSVNSISWYCAPGFGGPLGNATGSGRNMDAMGRSRAPGKRVGLADSFAKLWRSGGPPPDVFAFLKAHAGESARERADVLLIDQGNRWRAG